jgi:hypothetical protein
MATQINPMTWLFDNQAGPLAVRTVNPHIKRHRHLLVQDFRQLSPIPTEPDQWDVAAFDACDGSEGLLAAFTAGAGAGAWPEKRIMQNENECGNGQNTWEHPTSNKRNLSPWALGVGCWTFRRNTCASPTRPR